MPRGRPWTLALFCECTTPAGECIEWTGSRDASGYGDTWFRGKRERAHRIAWTLQMGELAPGQQILHRCDNPPCVRLDHLFVGDPAANVADMVQKGRHGTASLKPTDVRDIRSAMTSGERQRSIARRFGIDEQIVSDIKHGRHWAAVQ